MAQMTRRQWIRTTGATVGGAALAAAADRRGESAEVPRRPNILFILTDDQRWDTIRALGNPEIHTPNLDRLVERGFTFRNAYCMGAQVGAVCLPSRTMIATGLSLFRIPNGREKETPPGITVLPRLFNEAGYLTMHSGKAGNECVFSSRTYQINIETAKHVDATDVKKHCDNVIGFLQKHDPQRPFFVYLAPCYPHDPRIAPEEYRKMYDPEKITLSPNFMPEHPFDNGELHVRDENLAPHPRTADVMRRHLADYYACVTYFDALVGRILQVLSERGFDKNTLIVFASDQGLAVGGRHGLMGKQNLYEHVKPPLIIAGPGIPHGQSDALVYLFDLYPTFCELAGIAVPSTAEGRSLLPVIRGETPKVRDTLFAAYKACQRMVRDERWKLIKYNANGVKNAQLFDLQNDPDEIRNLADDPKFADPRARMEKLLAEARKQWGDNLDFDGSGQMPEEATAASAPTKKPAAKKASKKSKTAS